MIGHSPWFAEKICFCVRADETAVGVIAAFYGAAIVLDNRNG